MDAEEYFSWLGLFVSCTSIGLTTGGRVLRPSIRLLVPRPYVQLESANVVLEHDVQGRISDKMDEDLAETQEPFVSW
jgi:hypothetical protein